MNRLALSFAAAAVLAATPGATAAQRGGAAFSSSGTVPVSPSVLVTSIASNPPAGTPVLELLVLWRGAPGWFARPGTGGTSESSGGDSRGAFNMTMRRGGVELDLYFDSAKRSVRIGGKTIVLGADNVVLVDRVDEPGAMEIAGTAKFDGTPPTRGPYQPVFANAPELLSYLRCDVPSPDARTQSIFDLLCARAAGTAPVPAPGAAPSTPVNRVLVTGLVREPGYVEWREGLTVGDALAGAGGITDPASDPEDASPRSMIMRRAADGSAQQVARITRETVLLAGDILRVGRDLR